LAIDLLRRLLEHPLTSGLDLDDPATTELRKQIISSKPFLRAIYREWYEMLSTAIPEGRGGVLELGSGAGCCGEFISGLITSDLIVCPGIRVVADAQRLPFAADSLRGIVFCNVMHHLPDVRQFFNEAQTCLRSGGRIAMIEPWVSPWSTFINTRMHHEPFTPEATEWRFRSGGPLSGANGALPWIVFERDRQAFDKEFPGLRIKQIRPFLPFRYLVSGGVGMRSLMPGFMHPVWSGLERLLSSQMDRIAMFASIVLEKE
jgi:SAM-dependent methyltransferase